MAQLGNQAPPEHLYDYNQINMYFKKYRVLIKSPGKLKSIIPEDSIRLGAQGFILIAEKEGFSQF